MPAASQRSTKNGPDADPFEHETAPKRQANRVRGEVELRDSDGHVFIMRPTFAAALEIEDALGTGIDSFWVKMAASGVPGMPAATTREIGVVMAAGIRAAGEERATAEKCSEIAWKMGRPAMRKAIEEFMYALVHGGKLRDEALKKSESSSVSNGSDASDQQTREILRSLESHSDAT